jgi:putative flippase GtrA
MNVWVRWGKFNVVGVVGAAVQLTALALFHRVSAGRYLWATAAALEVTLLHNFVWHLHFTWRDRLAGGVAKYLLLARYVRFHMTNGAVSLVGNLALVRVLVVRERMPLVPANGVAILLCSLVNFALGERWVFGTAPSTGS